jgi:hypothetical protein
MKYMSVADFICTLILFLLFNLLLVISTVCLGGLVFFISSGAMG